MKLTTVAICCALSFCGSLAFAQSGGGSGGSSSGGGSGGGSTSSSSASGLSSGGSATTSTSISGQRDGSTLNNTLRTAPGSPGPNTYDALDQGTTGNRLGTIGGSNANGAGNATRGSSVDNLSSTTNTGVMAPASNSSVQPAAR